MEKQHYDDEVKVVVADLKRKRMESEWYAKGIEVLKNTAGSVYGKEAMEKLNKMVEKKEEDADEKADKGDEADAGKQD